MVEHNPVFSDVDASWRERWSILRSFVSSWFWLLKDGRYLHRQIQAIEQWSAARDFENKLGVRLPPSIKEWISLCCETDDEQVRLLRDDFAVFWTEEKSTLVIQVLCEGNLAWGIKRTDLNLQDPPVYSLDVEKFGDQDNTWLGNSWVCQTLEYQTLTEWVLSRILAYLPNETWLNVQIPRSKTNEAIPLSFLERLKQFFERHSRFGEYHIFESRNTLAGFRAAENVFRIVFRDQPDFPTLPGWLNEFSSDHRLSKN